MYVCVYKSCNESILSWCGIFCLRLYIMNVQSDGGDKTCASRSQFSIRKHVFYNIYVILMTHVCVQTKLKVCVRKICMQALVFVVVSIFTSR